MKRIAALFLLTSALAASAQTATAPAPIAPPTAGVLVAYQYWPKQFLQWISDADPLPYSMLLVQIDQTGPEPVYDVILTEKKTNRRIHYSNTPAVVGAAKVQGDEAYYVAMAFEWDGNFAVGNTATLRFTMHDEKPLEWRFVQGSDVSAQGGGITPVPEAKVPVFAYHELGAVAGEGTALQIGKVSSPAEVWKEISQPPYFVAYRGAMTQSAHQLILLAGTEHWTVAKAPEGLAAGNAWELDGDHGAHRTLHIDKVEGSRFTVTGSDSQNPSVRFTLQATQTADGWTPESVRLFPVKDGDKHFVALQFAPGSVDILVGKKTKIATATLAGGSLEMKTPAWAVGKNLVEQTTWKDGQMTVSAMPKP